MAEEMDFSDEFMKLHEESPYTNENIDTTLSDDSPKVSKKKKKGKKSKKEKELDDEKLSLLMDDIDISDDPDMQLTDDDIYLITKKGKKGKKKDLFDEKQAKKKKKKNLEARFNPELLALKRILKDADEAAGDIKAILARLKDSKARYVGKSLTDLLAALNTANSNRASVVRDIANIKKSIVDLNLKVDKANPKKNKDEDTDLEEHGINLFRTILGGSRKDMMNSAREYFKDNQSVDIDDDYDPNDDIEARLNAEGNKYRSEQGSAYIKYENMHPSDVIMYRGSDDWYCDAVDMNNQRMPDDYPRLNEDDLGNVQFNLEDLVAQDSKGRRFKVIDLS